MSRAFNGGTTADAITFAVGNAPPDQGPITIAVLAKANVSNFTGWAVTGRNGSTSVWSELVDSGKIFCENDFGSGGPTHGTGWCWLVMTKATGSAIPRFHKIDLTAGTAWVHQNDTSNVGDGSGPITSIIVGGNGGGAGTTWRGEIAVVATWDSVLSDASIEAALTLSAADTLAATPKWMIRLNQASTATSVSDDTGGGGNQTAISGTTVGADDPPGYSYTLTASGATPNGIAAAVALGSPTVALGRTAAPTGIAGAIALGQPATSIPSAAPTGIAGAIALGQPATALNLSVSPTGIPATVALGNPATALTLAAGPTGIALTTSLGLPTAGAQSQGAGPTGIALTLALGVPTAALMLSAAPSGIARTVLLGQPSSVPPSEYSSAHPRILTSSTAHRIGSGKTAARITTSSRPRRITD